jgi:peptidoglycan/LPS O-acetylase OafA/YrhL
LLATFLFRYQQGAVELNGHPFLASDVLIDPLFGVAYGALLLFLLSGRADRAMWLFRPLAFVGLFSYSLYLLHLPLVELTDEILPESSPPALREVALGSVAIVGSWLFFLVVERRFLRSCAPSVYPPGELPAQDEALARRRRTTVELHGMRTGRSRQPTRNSTVGSETR